MATFMITPIGAKFHELTILACVRRLSTGRKRNTTQTFWQCRCSCGRVVEVAANNVKNGHTRSCGHLAGDAPRNSHPHYGTPTYWAWGAIVQRCTNAKCGAFVRYGGRGITMCERWRLSFAAFFDDMGERPSDKHSIERIDNNGHYDPGNCRWATMAEQARNKRSNVWITWKGVTKTKSDWAAEIGMTATNLGRRLKEWPIDEAMTLPVQRSKWPRQRRLHAHDKHAS